MRLLRALQLEPSVLHLNEGHAAFAGLERISHLVHDRGLTFQEALLCLRASTVFTTHTPVAAGHDRFGEDLMRRYFADSPAWVGVPWEVFFRLGEAEEVQGSFNMTYLALRLAGFVNGVSRHHGEVSRQLLHPCWPRLLSEEIPIRSITNGVHLPTWTHPSVVRVLGAEGRPVDARDFRGVAGRVDRHELWKTRARMRANFLRFVKRRLKRNLVERGESPALLRRMLEGLEGDPLLIGFARRFAPYKRANLLFRDPERLAAILTRTDRPARVIVAGKAHPRDAHGQEILRTIVALSRGPLLGLVFFLEEYGLHLARRLLAGVDVWLNTPIRGLEASGTSGMKAALNGVLNVSIADGWWLEASAPDNGWTIGGGRTYTIQDLQDELDAEALYRLLEAEIVPTFYERNADGLPDAWIDRMCRSMETIPPVFDTNRMVGEYWQQAYEPLAERHLAVAPEGYASPRAAAADHVRLRRGFEGLRVLATHVQPLEDLVVGDDVEIQVDLDPGALSPDDLAVEFVHEIVDEGDSPARFEFRELEPVPGDAGHLSFVGTVRAQGSGDFSYALRVRARRAELTDLVVWIEP